MGEDFGAWHFVKCTFHHAIGTAVTVMHRITNQMTLFIQQAKIDAPGVDADACRIERLAFFDADLDVAPQPQKIPVQCAVDGDGGVGESVEFFLGEGTAVKLHRHHPPGFGPQIYSENGFIAHAYALPSTQKSLQFGSLCKTLRV